MLSEGYNSIPGGMMLSSGVLLLSREGVVLSITGSDIIALPSPFPRGQTDRCKNITLAGGNNSDEIDFLKYFF